MDAPVGHTTGDELAFLSSLGRGREVSARLDLLTRYRDAARVRANWGKVDRSLVLARAYDLIAEFSAQLPARAS